MNDIILTAEKYFLWLMLYSIMGWCYECVLESLRQSKLINRGFLNGPYCPIYGFGSLLDVVVLGSLHNPALIFILSAVLTCTLEYLTSLVMEKSFNVRWWDYNDFKFVVHGKEINVGKFNLNGRICLVGALAFGTLSIVLIYLIHPLIRILTGFIPPLFLHIISSLLLIIVVTDLIITLCGLIGFNEKLSQLSAAIDRTKAGIKESIDTRVQSSPSYEKITAVYAGFVKTLNDQQIRVMRSFPQLRSIKYYNALEELKKFVRSAPDKIRNRKNNK